MTERGAGVEQDPAAAAELYRQAAEKGARNGQARWGLALMEGRGVERERRRRANPGCAARRWRAIRRRRRWSATCTPRGGALPPNYAEAAMWFRRAAEAGHRRRRARSGLMHLTGAGVPRDPQRGGALVPRLRRGGRRAVARPNSRNLVLQGPGRAGRRARAPANGSSRPPTAGDLVAAFNYGICLAEGVGVERDDAQAAQWLRRAADGVVNAQFWYGRMLAEGRGVEADPEEGRAWIARAAEAGMVDAQVALAEMLVNGRGGPRDHPAGAGAVRSGRPRRAMPARCSRSARSTAAATTCRWDRPAAQRWFRAAAERGHGHAQMMLGRYLARGLAGERDPAEARIWLERAVAQGLPEAKPISPRCRPHRCRRAGRVRHARPAPTAARRPTAAVARVRTTCCAPDAVARHAVSGGDRGVRARPPVPPPVRCRAARMAQTRAALMAGVPARLPPRRHRHLSPVPRRMRASALRHRAMTEAEPRAQSAWFGLLAQDACALGERSPGGGRCQMAAALAGSRAARSRPGTTLQRGTGRLAAAPGRRRRRARCSASVAPARHDAREAWLAAHRAQPPAKPPRAAAGHAPGLSGHAVALRPRTSMTCRRPSPAPPGARLVRLPRRSACADRPASRPESAPHRRRRRRPSWSETAPCRRRLADGRCRLTSGRTPSARQSDRPGADPPDRGMRRAAHGGMAGWAWHPAEPDADPVLGPAVGRRQRGMRDRRRSDIALPSPGVLARPRGLPRPRRAWRSSARSVARDRARRARPARQPARSRRRAPTPRAAAPASGLAGKPPAERRPDARRDRRQSSGASADPPEPPARTRRRRRRAPARGRSSSPSTAGAGADDCLERCSPRSRAARGSWWWTMPRPSRSWPPRSTGSRRARRIRLIRHRAQPRLPGQRQCRPARRRRCRARDVVLLNSDTLVAAGLARAAARCGHAAPDIGTATPALQRRDHPELSRPGGQPGAATCAGTAPARRPGARAPMASAVVDIPTARRLLHVSSGATASMRPACSARTCSPRATARRTISACAPAISAGGTWRCPGVYRRPSRRRGRSAPRARICAARNSTVLERLHPGYDALIAAFAGRRSAGRARAGGWTPLRWRARGARRRRRGAAGHP